MLSSIKTYLANQARNPTGWFGRIVAPFVFNRENKHMEQFGLKIMDPERDDYILEIGFGNGRFISEMMSMIEEGKVCGIDISDEMVEVASRRNKAGIEKGRVELKKGSIAEIPYSENSFSKVFTCNTVYFWPDPVRNLREVKRVLRPGGTFYCVFRGRDLMESKSSAVTQNREVFEHLVEPEELKQMYEQAGFQNVLHRHRYSNSERIHLLTGKK